MAAALDFATAADDVTALAAVAWQWLGRPEEGPLAEIIREALEGDPASRPANATEFVQRLQAAALQAEAAGTPAVPPPDAQPEAHAASDCAAAIEEPRFEEPVLVDSLSNEHEFDAPACEPPEYLAFDEPAIQPAFEPAPAPSRRWRPVDWSLGAAIALAVGLLAGFAGGFTTGVRGELITPVPVATGGSEIPVPVGATPPPVAPPDLAAPDVPRASASAPTSVQPAPPAAREAAATLSVFSRPLGATVVVDGSAVGTTPLTAARVAPGRHVVRLTLRGYRVWIGAVEVQPGESARVAASLEQ